MTGILYIHFEFAGLWVSMHADVLPNDVDVIAARPTLPHLQGYL